MLTQVHICNNITYNLYIVPVALCRIFHVLMTICLTLYRYIQYRIITIKISIKLFKKRERYQNIQYK